MSRSLLPIIETSDNFPSDFTSSYPASHPTTGEIYVPFHLSFTDYQANLAPVGLLRPAVVSALRESEYEDDHLCPWSFYLDTHRFNDDDEMDGILETAVRCVFFADWVLAGGSDLMGKVMRETAERWRKDHLFPGPLGGWRDEAYMIYASPRSSFFSSEDSQPFSNAAFPLERSACAVFGFATFGVHMTAYEGQGDDMKIWVPRRSETKATWPSKLDNSVAGGIPAGMKPIESMIKECDEEASLPADLVKKYIKNCGVVTYFYITDDGYLQPEIEYVYDLKLPHRDDPSYVLPHPHDDEVESFSLLTIPEVLAALHSGQFKPNCGLVLVDFLIRHGLVTPEDEPNFIEITWRMRRRLGVAVPSPSV
ncbi:NUDIX hydrolase domain-like protein [Naematelia encephala]|uniref:NUDIX hydrolase domain-like protein n=1 Tax=Naematelia encephala TaxID=71784 RepID=A0A1Y2ARI2_9TREE|nr:NUDIX hydrolase domain-like protein [Naematelia encephala]